MAGYGDGDTTTPLGLREVLASAEHVHDFVLRLWAVLRSPESPKLREAILLRYQGQKSGTYAYPPDWSLVVQLVAELDLCDAMRRLPQVMDVRYIVGHIGHASSPDMLRVMVSMAPSKLGVPAFVVKTAKDLGVNGHVDALKQLLLMAREYGSTLTHPKPEYTNAYTRRPAVDEAKGTDSATATVAQQVPPQFMNDSQHSTLTALLSSSRTGEHITEGMCTARHLVVQQPLLM